jgi:hypothetical protein
MWLADLFPKAEFTYGYDYGSTAEEREQGFLALMQDAADRER